MLTTAEILAAAAERRLTCVEFVYYLNDRQLRGDEDAEVRALTRANLLRISRSIDFPRCEPPVVLTEAGEVALATAPSFAPEGGGA